MEFFVDQKKDTIAITYVEDLSIPDRSVLKPGVSAVKSFRFKNAGCTDIAASDVSLFLYHYDVCITARMINVPITVKAGACFTVDIPFITPEHAGRYQSLFKFQRRHPGKLFSPTVWLDFFVL